MNPKISDFGMARIFGVNESEVNTKRVVGTYYAAGACKWQEEYELLSCCASSQPHRICLEVMDSRERLRVNGCYYG
ncbi:hypothetical protein SLEP1_g50672 [Rubroshorea leprosula]|uniref:Protein kinase domain-containing protein n=1 Tax=Rubroshorea leprosula TaxID=152421 RepID=A0AAV5M0S5_9ROSI|nr:hypothetical protein SLEP1_g50672 [Rubroshorea leprosula]